MIRGPVEPIAIVGIGCRFPGARGPAEFWRMLREGRDGIRDVPAHRIELGFNIDEIYDPRPGTPGKISSRRAGFLDHPELFDPFVFGLSPRDAVAMEPHQRFAMEVVGDALDDAGIPHDSLMGERVAVIFGRMAEDYSREHIAVLGEDRFRRSMDVWGAAGISAAVLSGRISFWLGTRGPSFTLDTACSTSLLSVHLGCQSIWSGESRMAIAGGVNVFLTPEGMIALSRVGMLSPDGAIKAFDERANGFVRSEGAGAVILRPLAEARASGDQIYAVIRGTGFSADGRDGGHMMAPGRHGQAQAMRDAYQRAGIQPCEVHFVETHGTGTVIGDPVEVRALADVMAPGRPADRPLYISSVKGNIGHCEPASGVAGLIKAALAVREREMPPQLHFTKPSSAIPWHEVPIRVQAELAPWPYPEPALAGVNSFGISGTNAHVVLEQAPAPPPVAPDGERPLLVSVSAHTEGALVALAEALREEAAAGSLAPLRDLAFTLARRRTLHAQRLCVVARDAAELASELASFLSGAPTATTAVGAAAGKPPKLVFAFSGHGTHWAGMGRVLLAHEPAFAAALDAWDREQRRHVDWSLRELLERAVGGEALDRIDVLQPALTGIAIALARQWEHWGVRPSAVLGHSSGEIAAAHVAGCISLADAARIACARGAVVRALAPAGAMALVALPAAAVEAELSRSGARAVIAGANSPSMTVLSGDVDAIDALVAGFSAQSVFARRLRVEFASHSPHMDALAPELERRIAGVAPQAGAVPFHSTVTAAELAGSELDARYWAQNLRAPVRFAETAAGLVAGGAELFLEIGPNPVLRLPLEEIQRAAKRRPAAVPSLRREVDDRVALLGALGALFAAGARVDLAAIHPEGRVVTTPLYPYQREEYWFGGKRGIQGRRSAHPFVGLLGANATSVESSVGRGTRLWQIDLGKDALGSELKLGGKPVVPLAQLAAIAAGVAARLWPGEESALRELASATTLELSGDPLRTLQLVCEEAGSAARLRFSSRPAGGSGGAWQANAECRIERAAPRAAPAQDLAAVRRRCARHVPAEAFYAALEEAGLQCARERRVLAEAWLGEGEALARVVQPAQGAALAPIDPVILDAACQLLAEVARLGPGRGARWTVVGCQTLEILDPGASGELFVSARAFASSADAAQLHGELALLRASGARVATLSGVRLARSAVAEALAKGPWLYALEREGEPQLAALRDAARPPRIRAGARAFEARAASPEELVGATLHEMRRRAPGPGEIEIEVRAAGLSFLDVLRTLGLESEAGAALGCECSGVVSALGPGVRDFALGDPVLAFARGALASHVVTPAALAVAKPATLDFAAAAAAPLALALARHALRGIARLGAQERIFVHSAGGAIGLAAVGLARALGAEVYASAGSEAKRARLRAEGARVAVDARSPEVAAEVLRASGGRGMDVVLDLAGGEGALAALAPGGRYLRLDRSGSPAAAPAGRRNVSLHVLDPLGLLATKPEELALALRAALAEGALRPGPLTVFPIGELGRAIRFMAQARHVGKVVVSFDGAAGASIEPLLPAQALADGAVLALGALDRFPAPLEWLAAQRPREVLWLAPAGADEARVRRELAASPDTRLVVRPAAGERLDLAAACRELRAPLRALWLAADPVDGAALAEARALARFATERTLDLFWLLTPARALLAEDGGTAAALAELGALARERRAAGEPATHLCVGLDGAEGARAGAALDRAARAGEPELLVHTTAPSGWDPASSAPILRGLIAAASASGASSALAGLPPEERRAKLRELTAGAVAAVLHLSTAERARIDWHRPLAELGLDSLMGIELHVRLEEAAGVSVPAALMFSEPNLDAIVEKLGAALAARGGGA